MHPHLALVSRPPMASMRGLEGGRHMVCTSSWSPARIIALPALIDCHPARMLIRLKRLVLGLAEVTSARDVVLFQHLRPPHSNWPAAPGQVHVASWTAGRKPNEALAKFTSVHSAPNLCWLNTSELIPLSPYYLRPRITTMRLSTNFCFLFRDLNLSSSRRRSVSFLDHLRFSCSSLRSGVGNGDRVGGSGMFL